MLEHKEYPETSREYRFIRQCYANQLRSVFGKPTNQFVNHLLGNGLNNEEDPQQIKARKEFEEHITIDNSELIEHQRIIFDELAKDFSCEKGKHESKKERAEKGCMGQNNLTYGEVMF